MKNAIFTTSIIFVLLLALNASAQENIEPFLKIPFKKGTNIELSEGWVYSEEEKSIHGITSHQATDFAVPRGTPVYAAASGYAISSSQISYLDRNYQGKKVGYSYGNFVQIWHPEQKVFTLYAHMDRINNDIPYFPPIKHGNKWIPVGIHNHLDPGIFNKSKFVQQGDLLGFAGDSGLSWGYEEFPEARPDPLEFPSWDEVHLHFEVLKRNQEGVKLENFDPFGIYGEASQYPKKLNPETSLWILDENNDPLYAKE